VRIVHVLTVPFSFRLLKGQAAYLHARGYDIHAISSPGCLADEYEKSEPVTVHRVPMTRAITPLADLVALLRLVRMLRGLRPEIVQAGTPKAGLLGMLAAWLIGVPVRIYHVRGLPLTTAAGLRRRLLRLTERIACACATRVLCVSRSMREVIIAEGICDPDRVEVLLEGSSNGVDVQRFDSASASEGRQAVREGLAIPADAVVIGFVGRLVREKGIVELVEAWKRLRDVSPAARLLLIGPFEDEDALPAHVRRTLQSDPRVHLTGVAWDTPSLYAAMDVLCLPSHREGFPKRSPGSCRHATPSRCERCAGSDRCRA
jgi:glycosyltransferase involved in cell wall biosynthesis